MAEYERGKVGDDIPLQIALMNLDGTPRNIESARITILNARGARVVNEAVASQVADHIAQYMFTPEAPSVYIVEWHLVHGGGLDKYVRDIQLPIDRRRAV